MVVLAAARDLGVGEQVVQKVTAGLVSGDPRYRWLEHRNNPISEIEQAADWSERQSG